MKRILHTVLFVLTFATCFAQESPVKRNTTAELPQSEPEIATAGSTGSSLVKNFNMKSALEDFISTAGVSLLDSTITYTFDSDTDSTYEFRNVYDYNAAANTISDILSVWDTSVITWVDSSKVDYEYFTSADSLIKITSYWDSADASWVNDSKYKYESDSVFTLSTWDTASKAWEEYLQEEYEYDSVKNLTNIYYYEMTSYWKIANKVEYEYDSLGNQISCVFQNFADNKTGFVYSYKYEYEYDSLGNQISVLYSTYNSNKWTISYKNVYEYDSLNNKTIYEHYELNNNGDLVLSDKYIYEYAYNEAGEINSITSSKLSNKKLILLDLYEYKYDVYGNLIKAKGYNYDSDAFSFYSDNLKYYYYTYYSVSTSDTSLSVAAEENSTVSFTVSSDASWSLSTDASWFTLSDTEGTGESTITLTAQENSTSDIRTATIKMACAYSDTITITVSQYSVGMNDDIVNTDVNPVKVYPNPTEGLVYINAEGEDILSISVLSVSGKTIWTSNAVSNSNTIDMSDFNGNLFILQVQTSDKIYTSQLIKK